MIVPRKTDLKLTDLIFAMKMTVRELFSSGFNALTLLHVYTYKPAVQRNDIIFMHTLIAGLTT